MIVPGILEDTFEKVRVRVKSLEDLPPLIQIDIADGILVEGKTFLDVQKISRINTKSELSIHFMVQKPSNFLRRSFCLFPFFTRKIRGVSTVITQVVENKEVNEFIKLAKKMGYKVGVSLNHGQEIIDLDPYIGEIDLVQFMSVVPGKQGNEFIPSVIEKIRRFKNSYPAMLTQIDGGINESTLPLVLESGVDNIVVGSAIFNSESPKNKFLEFSKAAHGSINNT